MKHRLTGLNPTTILQCLNLKDPRISINVGQEYRTTDFKAPKLSEGVGKALKLRKREMIVVKSFKFGLLAS